MGNPAGLVSLGVRPAEVTQQFLVLPAYAREADLVHLVMLERSRPCPVDGAGYGHHLISSYFSLLG